MTFSIITVCYNAVKELEKTILSVINQDCEDFEFIIIDGGSSLETQEIIKQYRDNIDVFISEADKGIYDAMNKGVIHASGDYCIMMNTDDTFVNKRTLSRVHSIMKHDNFKSDIYFGNSIVENEYGVFENTIRDIKLMRYKSVLSHQATFVRSDLLRNHPFDLKYKYCADYKQLSTLYLNGYSFYRLNICVAVTPIASGATYNNYIESTKEHFSILKERGENVFWKEYKTLFLRILVRLIKRVLPISCLKYISKYKVI